MYCDSINQTLPVSDDAGLDTFDPRFSDITAAIQSGDFPSACTQVLAVFGEGKYDIRLVGYLCFGDFVDYGLTAISNITSALALLLEENWDAYGPLKSKEKHAKAMFNWLLQNLTEQLGLTQSAADANWVRWTNECNAETIAAVMETTARIGDALPVRLGDQASALDETFSRFRAWLRSFHDMQAQAEAAEAPEPEPEPVAQESAEASAGAPAAAPAQVSQPEGMSIQGSYPLRKLIAKMKAFGELTARGEFARAAIVSMDVQEIMANFDPSVYFPELFSDYKLQMAQHISDLMTYASSQDTPEWRAMEEYYKVDLDGFLNM